MKHIFLLLLMLAFLEMEAQPVPIEVRCLQDYYYVGEGFGLKNGINCYVLSSKKDYKKLFGTTNRPDTTDFSKEIMLVLLMKKTNWNAKVTINKVCMKAGNFIEAYCHIDEGRYQLTYKAYPMAVCIIPRYPGVRRIDFYDDWKMKPIVSLPVK